LSRPEPSESVERERILVAARNLLEVGGPDALSMRRLASQLGVAHTAIYWHVGGRDDLIGAIVDEFIAELGEIKPKGRGPRQRTESIVRGIWNQVAQHPVLVSLALEHGRFATMWFPAQLALAREVSASGLKGSDAARAVTTLLYVTGAFVTLESALAEHAGEAQESAELWSAVEDPAIEKGLRTRMARGVDVAAVFDDTLDAVLNDIFPTTRSS
jgi:TetR/AcrR family transcriptional regulator, tetracycline repressor protein